jgi:hypothetical protein
VGPELARCVHESSFRSYTIEACRNTFEFNIILKFEFRDLEMPRSNGGDSEIDYAGVAVTMKMNSDDKLLCENIANNSNISVLK